MAHAKLLRLAENEVQRTLTKLPPDVRAAAEECSVHYEADNCSPEDADEDFLGLFEGNNRLDPPPSDPGDMPRITLFLVPLWDFANCDDRSFRDEVRITYLHELGHYLGWDEAQVEALGLG